MGPRPVHGLFSKDGDSGLSGNAARSNEMKMRRKVQMLRNEAISLLSELTLLQRETSDLITAISELKLRIKDMEQHNRLQDVLKEELDEEIQRLKEAAGLDLGTSITIPPFGSNQQPEPAASHEDRAANGAATPPGPAT